MLSDRRQVREELARVERVGQRIDDGHARVSRHLLDPRLLEGAPDDRRTHPTEHPGGVRDGLADADLGQVAVHQQRVATELSDPGAEGDLGAQRRLVEDDRDRPRPGERAVREAVLAQGERQDEHLALLGWREVVVAQEVSRHGRASSGASAGTVGPGGVGTGRVSPAMNVTKVSACAQVRMSGGASRTASGVGAFTMKPASRAAWNTCGATGAVSSIASSSPSPRTPAMSGLPLDVSAVRRYSPTVRTFASRPSRSITPSVARAAAAATGFPPKVEPCWPGPSRDAGPSPNATTAPIGKPPPSPLARVITSGTMPPPSGESWCANHSPVRPTPVCTSSRTRSAPYLVASSRAAGRYPAGSDRTPISPWIGSRTMAATSSPIASSSAATSPNGMNSTPPGSGSKGARKAGLCVIASAPIERPWNEPSSARMRGRPVRRAILKTASFASVPEFAKKTRDPCGARARSSSRSASATWVGEAKKLEMWPRVPSWAEIAAVSVG